MRVDECILIIRGLYPFYGKKFDYPKHKNYPKTGDADKALLYINTKDNSEPPTRDALNAEYEKIRAARIAKATTSKNPAEQIISEPINIDTFINSLNIRDKSDIKSKIIIVGPEDYQQIKPSQKEQQEQAAREEQRQERKKKKKKKKNGVNTSNDGSANAQSQKEESVFDNMDFSDFETNNKKS